MALYKKYPDLALRRLDVGNISLKTRQNNINQLISNVFLYVGLSEMNEISRQELHRPNVGE